MTRNSNIPPRAPNSEVRLDGGENPYIYDYRTGGFIESPYHVSRVARMEWLDLADEVSERIKSQGHDDALSGKSGSAWEEHERYCENADHWKAWEKQQAKGGD